MMLTDLADACRSSKLPVVETAAWRTRGHGPMSGVRAIVLHHTAGAATGEVPSLGTVTNGRPDLPGPLAQLVLGRTGAVYVVAAGLAYHAGVVNSPDVQGNAWSIGIEAEATGVTTWPPVQYDAYIRLAAALCRHYQLGSACVWGHKEVAKPAGRKIDPNFAMPPFRAAVASLLAPPAAPPAPVSPPRRSSGDPMYLKCESVKGGTVWTGLLSGGYLLGPLSPGETASADANVKAGAVPLQWVERATWDHLMSAAA